MFKRSTVDGQKLHVHFIQLHIIWNMRDNSVSVMLSCVDRSHACNACVRCAYVGNSTDVFLFVLPFWKRNSVSNWDDIFKLFTWQLVCVDLDAS